MHEIDVSESADDSSKGASSLGVHRPRLPPSFVTLFCHFHFSSPAVCPWSSTNSSNPHSLCSTLNQSNTFSPHRKQGGINPDYPITPLGTTLVSLSGRRHEFQAAIPGRGAGPFFFPFSTFVFTPKANSVLGRSVRAHSHPRAAKMTAVPPERSRRKPRGRRRPSRAAGTRFVGAFLSTLVRETALPEVLAARRRGSDNRLTPALSSHMLFCGVVASILRTNTRTVRTRTSNSPVRRWVVFVSNNSAMLAIAFLLTTIRCYRCQSSHACLIVVVSFQTFPDSQEKKSKRGRSKFKSRTTLDLVCVCLCQDSPTRASCCVSSSPCSSYSWPFV